MRESSERKGFIVSIPDVERVPGKRVYTPSIANSGVRIDLTSLEFAALVVTVDFNAISTDTGV